MNMINYGNTLHQNKEYKQSIDLHIKALEIIDSLDNPDDYLFSDKYVLKRNLADLLISNGAYDKAMALLNEIINKDSNPTWKAIVYFDKAKVQTLLKDYKSAIRNLKKSINTFDDSEHYMLYDAIYLLFKNYLQIQNPKAIDVLEELIEIKIDILKKNECFLSSEANLISQSEILNLIH